jgi:hypothetical protein
MKRDEHETTISWDYPTGTLRIYTTRESVLKEFTKRLGAEYITAIEQIGDTYSFTVPMAVCRKPGAVAKLINPEAKGAPMTEEQKAKRFGTTA